MSKVRNALMTIFVGMAMGLALSACSDSSSSTTADLGDPPEGFEFTDADGNPIDSIESGETVQLRDEDGVLIASFVVDGDIDLSGLIAGRTGDVAFAHFPNVDGLEGVITLFVPCTADINTIYVTPGAESATEVSLDGSGDGVITLSVDEPGPTEGYTFVNADDREGDEDCEISAAFDAFSTGAAGANVIADPVCEDECGDHATCVGVGTDAECECDEGYAGDGQTCVRQQTVENFEGETDDWELDDATIDTNEETSSTAMKVFTTDNVCEDSRGVKTITIPAWAKSLRFDLSGSISDNDAYQRIRVQLGTYWGFPDTPVTSTEREENFCVPENLNGEEVDLQFVVQTLGECIWTGVHAWIDNVVFSQDDTDCVEMSQPAVVPL